MRTFISILLTLAFSGSVPAQNISKQDPPVQRLYQEITSSFDVQQKFIGCYGHLSVLYKKVDTLKQTIGLNSFVQYFNDSSVNLKYYAFLELLALNDEDAYEKLAMQSGNSDIINFTFAGQYDGYKVKLPELLIAEYLRFIKMKYYYGGVCTVNTRAFKFPKRNRRTWRRKYERTMGLIAARGLSKKWIDSFH